MDGKWHNFGKGDHKGVLIILSAIRVCLSNVELNNFPQRSRREGSRNQMKQPYFVNNEHSQLVLLKMTRKTVLRIHFAMKIGFVGE